MIFVTLGSQKFQFNRLLKELDKLIDNGTVNEKVFAQVGYSNYIPKNYSYKDFLDRDEFLKYMNECDKVVTHGGTGAIIGAVKNKKKVIAVPRNQKFKEHVDNHQYEIVKAFSEMNLVVGLTNLEKLSEVLSEINDMDFSEYKSNTENIIFNIDEFIDNL